MIVNMQELQKEFDKRIADFVQKSKLVAFIRKWDGKLNPEAVKELKEVM